MEDTRLKFIENQLIAFNINITQEKKGDVWKKKMWMFKGWQNSTIESINCGQTRNSMALLTGKKNGIIVVDIDNVRHWKKLLEKVGKTEPKTVKAISASGGIHLY